MWVCSGGNFAFFVLSSLPPTFSASPPGCSSSRDRRYPVAFSLHSSLLSPYQRSVFPSAKRLPGLLTSNQGQVGRCAHLGRFVLMNISSPSNHVTGVRTPPGVLRTR